MSLRKRSSNHFITGLIICFLTAAAAQAATPWRFVRTYLQKNWNTAQIEHEDVNAGGGLVDLVLSGKPFNLCPAGTERIRVTWRFDKPIVQLNPGETFGAKIEARMTSYGGDCNGGLAYRTYAEVSAGVASMSWDQTLGMRTDGNRFQTKVWDRANAWKDGRNAASSIIEVFNNEPYPDRLAAGFVVYIGGPGGEMAYLYAYQPVMSGSITGPVGGAQPPADPGSAAPDLAGTWYREGNTGLPASIRQSGNSLVFTNERGESSYGRFESKGVIVALDWESGLRGRLNADRTRIDWGNGTSWSRRPPATSFAAVGGKWYREGNRTLAAEIIQSGASLLFINERGERSGGRFLSQYVVVADEWERGLRGTLDPGLRKISWANGSTWQR